jgi:pentapeptide MXKDX repeat protein
MNKSFPALLSACLISLAGFSLSQSAAASDDMSQGAMTMQKTDADHMDKGTMTNGAMKPATKTKEAMDKSKMKMDAANNGEMKPAGAGMMKGDAKPTDKMEPSSMQRAQ